MTCFRPIEGFRSITPNKSGKRSIVFNPKDGIPDQVVVIPCGKCLGCRLEYSRQWAIRCVHEAKMHDNNCFITLTYDNENLPENGSLEPKDFQRFMKYLRRDHGPGIRFFACGEYGEGKTSQEVGRPHYHALLFGYDPHDKRFQTTQSGNEVYSSDSLDRLWARGITQTGQVSFKSAAYVARYSLKKQSKHKNANYDGKVPEFVRMSRRPGIGANYYALYGDEVQNTDSVVIDQREVKPPSYYDRLLEKTDPGRMEEIKKARKEAANPISVHDERRHFQKERFKNAQIKNLRRDKI